MDPIRVLLVDDNATFLRAARRFLAGSDGIVVVDAVLRGTEALARAQTLRPDVALVDLAMPDVPELEVIRRLRTAWSTMGIIALTLLDGASYREAALAAGADDFVAKSTLHTDLLPAIQRVTGGGKLPAAPARKEGEAS